jgi:hypothetical protein
MFLNRIMAAATVAAAILLAGPLSARAENWELLGEKRVGFVADHDAIEVGRHEGRFRKIKIVARDNDVDLERIKVIYGNGEPEVIDAEIKIHRGGESRVFDLEGYARTIQRIELWYHTKFKHLLRGEALVQVFGDQAGGDHGGGRHSEGGHDRFRGGQWELLGSQSVAFHVDHDVIRVGRREGRFTALKLKVHDNTVYFEKVRVVYGNGEADDLPMRSEIRGGNESRSLDLKGGERFIREIHLVYRSKPNDRGRATVEVFGLKD